MRNRNQYTAGYVALLSYKYHVECGKCHSSTN